MTQRPSQSPHPSSANTTTAQPTEVLAGSIERVTFHNADNGFCVLRIKARGHRELVTVVGHAAEISAGEWVTLSGTWVNSREHGQQFKASFLKASAPTTAEGIEKYLGSGMIRGIGPIYAGKLVGAFGAGVFEVIEQEPDRQRTPICCSGGVSSINGASESRCSNDGPAGGCQQGLQHFRHWSSPEATGLHEEA
jgi:hypothetical protein